MGRWAYQSGYHLKNEFVSSGKRMKDNNPKLFRQAVPTLAAFCVIVMALCSCSRSPSYFGFLKHDKEYYAEIAESCRNLLSQTNYFSKAIDVRGDDPSLPKPILDLHATTIRIANRILFSTNYTSGISISFGEGRPDFTIAWYQNDYGNGNCPWELAVNGDGPHTVVFSTNLAPSAPTVLRSSQADEPGH